MVRSHYEALVSGDGACAGCGEKSVLRGLASLTEAYRGYVREAAERQRAGQAVEEKLITDIADLQERVAENMELIAGLKQRGVEIEIDFTEELTRYRTLVEEKEALASEKS
jgi:DnaJ-domain-containing protein 1